MTKLKEASDRQKILKQKHDMICNEYVMLRNEHPEAAVQRVFDTIADRHGMTIPGVRNIIIKAGLYTPNK